MIRGSGTFRTQMSRLYKDTAAKPNEIPQKLNKPVSDYEKESADLEKILEFHVQFDRICPIADYSGRVGRLILVNECLLCGVEPLSRMISAEVPVGLHDPHVQRGRSHCYGSDRTELLGNLQAESSCAYLGSY